MDWTRPRHERFEYLRIDREGALIGTLGGVTGATISENLNTALKASGTLTVTGEADLDDDRVCAVLIAEQDGETAEVVLGTFLASSPRRSRMGPDVITSVELYSVLLVLLDDKLESTLTVPSGTDAVVYARALVEGAGLTVSVTPDGAAHETTVDAVYEAGTPLLDIVNDMLGFAGYSSAGVDGYGRVTIQPYVDPAGRGPAWTFRDGDGSVFMPPVADELDRYDTPNVVVVRCTGPEDAGLIPAVAENNDPASPLSTVSRGRRIVRYEEVSDIESQEALQAKADLLLLGSTRSVNLGTVRHTYVPLSIGDAARLDYQEAGIDYRMIVQSREMELVAGVPTTTVMRRFV